jgi:hypothetical protein
VGGGYANTDGQDLMENEEIDAEPERTDDDGRSRAPRETQRPARGGDHLRKAVDRIEAGISLAQSA